MNQLPELPIECGVCEYNHQEGMYLVCCHGDVQGTVDSVNAPVAPMCPSSGRATWCPLKTEDLQIKGEVGECKRCPHNHLYQMIAAGSYTYSGEIPCLNCLSDASVTDTWRERKEAMSQQGGGSIEELEPIEELPVGHCDITVRKKIDEISRKVNILMENF